MKGSTFKVMTRTVELRGTKLSHELPQSIRKAFASGGFVAFEGRCWRVEAFVIDSGEPGTILGWNARMTWRPA